MIVDDNKNEKKNEMSEGTEGRPGGCWTSAYLAALERSGKQTASADAAGVAFSTVFRRRKADPMFAASESEAMQTAKARFEDEAIRRAVEGVTTTRKFDKDGNLILERVEHSDLLLLRLLEKLDLSWRQKNQMELSGGVSFDSREDRKKALEEARRGFAAGTS